MPSHDKTLDNEIFMSASISLSRAAGRKIELSQIMQSRRNREFSNRDGECSEIRVCEMEPEPQEAIYYVTVEAFREFIKIPTSSSKKQLLAN